MTLGFSGEVVDFYHRYRRGYPPPVIDALVAALALRDDDLLLDLGCGTGQLTVPLAARCRAVIGMDPSPDMLSRARAHDVPNATWILGADTDIPAFDDPLGAVTIGQALHWMDPDTLFRRLRPMLRDGGAIAVVTNGLPAWLQDSDWSRALRAFLEEWRGERLTFPCGSDEASQQRYAHGLRAAGYEVGETAVEYPTSATFEQLIGGVYSAIPADELPAPAQRPAFAERLRQALPPGDTFAETVQVRLLIGTRERASASAPRRQADDGQL